MYEWKNTIMEAWIFQHRIDYLKKNLMLGKIVNLTAYRKPTSLVSHVDSVQNVKKRYRIIGIYDNYILCQSLEKAPYRECFKWDQVVREVNI